MSFPHQECFTWNGSYTKNASLFTEYCCATNTAGFTERPSKIWFRWLLTTLTNFSWKRKFQNNLIGPILTMRFLSTTLQNTCFLVECMISNWKHNDSKVWKHFWYYIYLKPQNAFLIQTQCKPKTAYRKLTSLKMCLITSHCTKYSALSCGTHTHPRVRSIPFLQLTILYHEAFD